MITLRNIQAHIGVPADGVISDMREIKTTLRVLLPTPASEDNR